MNLLGQGAALHNAHLGETPVGIFESKSSLLSIHLQWQNRCEGWANGWKNKYGTVQELRSTFSQIKSNIVLWVCMWTCEFVFGLVSSYLDGCDKQKKNKYGSVQELRSTFSHIKSINIDFSLVWLVSFCVDLWVGWDKKKISWTWTYKKLKKN